MSDVKGVYEMVTKKVEPDRDSWTRQQEKQRRIARARKWGAIVVAAAIMAGLAVFVVSTRPGNGGDRPAASPTALPVTEPPIGATILNLDGSVRALIPGLPDDATDLQLSPDGTAIAFMDGPRVAVIGADGSGLRVLIKRTNNTDGDAHQRVAWSPDGARIAYVANDDLYTMDADGSHAQRLTDDPAGDYQPAWSVDGVIAYWHGSTIGEDGGPQDSEIYTIAATGGTPARLTHDADSSIAPAWSPDGSTLAYFRGGELWEMRADGSDPRLRYRAPETPSFPGGAWSPAFSPNGERIAFLTCCATHRSFNGRPLLELRVLDRSGGVQEFDVRVETDSNGPSWASNGSLLINRYD